MSSHHKSRSFKKLQHKWDKKLKESGFEDIEDRNSKMEFLKQWHGGYFQRNWDGSRYEYFLKASAFLNSYLFQSEIEKSIWEGHADGKTIREIAKELSHQKDAVHKVIKKLRAIMLVWAIPDDPEAFSVIGIDACSTRKQ